MTLDDDCEHSNIVPPWAQKMILELSSVQQKIKEHLPTIQATTSKIEAELSGLAIRIDQVEQCISNMEDLLPPISKSQKALESLTSDLAQKVDYVENYLRRKNLRIVNIPENLEGTNIKSFTTDLLKDILQIPSDQRAIGMGENHAQTWSRDLTSGAFHQLLNGLQSQYDMVCSQICVPL